MSAITSAGVNGPDLYQVLQNVSGSSSSTTSTSVGAAAATDDGTEASSTQSAGHGHGHHHHHGISSKIESAVTSALQNAPSGSDPNTVVKNAITSALQGGQDGSSQTPGADGQSAAAGTAANGTSSQAAFTQLLQSYGISPQQFEQDLQASLPANAAGADGSTGGTGVDFSQLFKSFPPGSAIETTG